MAILPALSEEAIAGHLRATWGIDALAFAQVAGGADLANLVFRVTAGGGAYCVKVRTAPANASALALARSLADSGIEAVVAPLPTHDGRLECDLGTHRLIVYPWIDGAAATLAAMTDVQWADLGRSLRRIHDSVPGDALVASLRNEEFSPRWRDKVKALFSHPPPAASRTGAELMALMRAHNDAIQRLLDFSTRHAALLRPRGHAAVPCHGDLHAANVLLDGAHACIVDWDDPVLAPRERDLMFIGAGICGVWKRPHDIAAFYRGYGPCKIDPALLAYYRCERIVEDIAVTCGEILDEPGDRPGQVRVLGQLADQFEPGNVVEIALRTARDLEDA